VRSASSEAEVAIITATSASCGVIEEGRSAMLVSGKCCGSENIDAPVARQ
jgi:hypothetical protein